MTSGRLERRSVAPDGFWPRAAVVGGTTLAMLAAVVAGWSLVAALEARAGVAAASELQLAAATVAAADAVEQAGGDTEPFDVAGAIAVLSRDRDPALAALDGADRAEAERLTDEIVNCGVALLGPEGEAGDGTHPEHDHQALQAILARAADGAADTAARSELRLGVALGAVVAATVVTVAIMLGSRRRETLLRRRLAAQSTTDPLTGLSNRRALAPTLERVAVDMAVDETWTGFIQLDLDGFRLVNELLGSAAGDQLLCEVAERLDSAGRSTDHLFRAGSDEFVAVVPGLESPDAALRAAERLSAQFDEPFIIDGGAEQLRVSVGVAVTADPEELPRLGADATLAVDAAKRGGGGAVVAFEPPMVEEAAELARIARALAVADHDREFRLVFQPIVSVDGQQVLGHEALLRWNSPSVGEVGPDRFIPVAERSGEILAIGRWVIERACDQLEAWHRRWPDDQPSISVNVSARQLDDDDFVGFVVAAADRRSFARSQLVIEVTESAVLDDRGVAKERLTALRAAGFRIAIDDFGSGYSNLGQLLGVPCDIIKIDRSLLLMLTSMRDQMGGDPSSPCAIMSAIVSIASVFEARVVCEGVETELQRYSLERSGITHVQGYLMGRPVPADEISSPSVLTH